MIYISYVYIHSYIYTYMSVYIHICMSKRNSFNNNLFGTHVTPVSIFFQEELKPFRTTFCFQFFK